MPITAKLPLAAVPRPITVATPRMISQMGLVCLLAAMNAGAGRRIASMNAHVSTTRAAMASASKSQERAEYAPGLLNSTMPGYRLAAGFGARHDRLSRQAAPFGTASPARLSWRRLEWRRHARSSRPAPDSAAGFAAFARLARPGRLLAPRRASPRSRAWLVPAGS